LHCLLDEDLVGTAVVELVVHSVGFTSVSDTRVVVQVSQFGNLEAVVGGALYNLGNHHRFNTDHELVKVIREDLAWSSKRRVVNVVDRLLD